MMQQGIDPRSIEKAMNRRKGLFQQMGDAAGFVRNLLQGDTITPKKIEQTIQELKNYVSTCFSQIDDLTEEWERTYEQIVQIKKKLKSASPPQQKRLKSQGKILLRRYDGYEGNLSGFEKNGLEAEVVIERLRVLIPLMDVPDAMKEDRIDDWAAALESQISERAVTERALEELEGTRPVRSDVGEPSTDIESEDEKALSDRENREPSAADKELDRRLEEEFSE